MSYEKKIKDTLSDAEYLKKWEQDAMWYRTGQYVPSILIGLGGTGTKALHHMRQLFFERYGTAVLPGITYLSIDTDVASARPVGDADLQGPAEEAISFKDKERINVSASLTALMENLRQGTGEDHIREWWDPNTAIYDDLDISKGSGQIRPLSRVVCFKNKEHICRAIKSARIEVTNLSVDNPRVIDNGNCNVYIIAGLAGGTGSGMFLDIAGMVKATLGYETNITGYLVLPDVYKNIEPTAFDKLAANGVAALRELNHYMDNHFEVDWGDGKIHRIPGLYNKAFLFTASNLLNKHLPKVKHAYRTIGQALFLQFAGGNLPAFINSVHINRSQYLLGKVQATYQSDDSVKHQKLSVHTESWRTCFSGFGVSKLSYPTWRLFHYARYDLAKRLINLMPQQPANTPNISAQHFQQELGIFQGKLIAPEESQNPDKIVNMIEDQLVSLTKDDTIFSAIQARCNQLVVDGSNMADDAQGTITAAFYSLDYLLKEKLGDDTASGEEGEWAQLIKENQKSLEQTFKPTLAETMNDYYEKYGLFALQKIIDETIKSIEVSHDQSHYIDHLRLNAEKYTTKSARVKLEWQRLVDQIEVASDFSAEIYQAAVEAASQQLADYWTLQFQSYVCTCSIQFLEYSLVELNQALTRINHIIHGLEELSHRFTQLRDSYRHTKDNPLFQELEVEHNYDELLHPYLGYTAEDQERRLTILSQKVMGQGGLNLTSVDALEHAILKEPKQFRDQLSAALFTALKGGPNGKTTAFVDNSDPADEGIDGFLQRHSILNVLKDSYINHSYNTERRLEDQLKQVFEHGLPWVADGKADMPAELRGSYNEVYDAFVGIPRHGPQTLVPKIVKIAKWAAKANGLNFRITPVPTADPSEIVFYTETHAYPIFHLGSLYGEQGLYRSYERLIYHRYNKTALHLHRDFHTFGRLIPMNANERQTYKQALQFFLEGQIIGIFQTENAKLAPQTSNQYHFVQRQEQNGTIRYETLGSEDEVVHYLSHQSQQKTKLLLAAQRQHLRNLGVIFADLCAITRYWMHCLYPLREIQNGEIVGSIEFSVLEKLEAEYKNLSTENNELSDEIEFDNHIYDRLMNLQSWTVPIARSKGSKFPWRATISPESRVIQWGKEEGLVESLTGKLDSYIQKGWIDPTLLRSTQKVFPSLAINPRFWQVEQKDQAPPPFTTQPTPPNPSFWYSPDPKRAMLCRASEIANRFQHDVKPMICVDQNWSAAVQSVADIKAWLDYENQAEPPPLPPPLP